MISGRAHALRITVWLVVASEGLLFAGLFALYAGYRAEYPRGFAEGVGLAVGWLGGTNTLVLLTSSFAMAAAIQAGPRAARRWLVGVLGLGGVFLGLKGAEWAIHIGDGLVPGAHYAGPHTPGTALFVTLYYAMTGLHALHLVAGLAMVAWARRREDPAVTECVGIYWHFVDLVWVVLWPLFYLLS